jgi:hypothetical protein
MLSRELTHPRPSPAGLTRESIRFARKMDCRVKPGKDVDGGAMSLRPRPTLCGEKEKNGGVLPAATTFAPMTQSPENTLFRRSIRCSGEADSRFRKLQRSDSKPFKSCSDRASITAKSVEDDARFSKFADKFPVGREFAAPNGTLTIGRRLLPDGCQCNNYYCLE